MTVIYVGADVRIEARRERFSNQRIRVTSTLDGERVAETWFDGGKAGTEAAIAEVLRLVRFAAEQAEGLTLEVRL